MLFHLIPFIYGTPENRTFRPENGSFSQSTHSWSSTVFVGFFRRIHDGKPLRLRPRPSASILNVKQNLPHFQKSGSVLAPHLELNELDARVTPWSYTLVIGCIETNICTEICVGKLPPTTTVCSPLHRSIISKFSLEIAERSTQVLKVWGVRAQIVGRALPTP